ncbi:MAG: hypothetical protein HGA51_08825 [Demequinaceae bacterium]|nr:hypothetical protein [Demequinaceae bacterium]
MSEGPEPTPIDVPTHAIPATYRRAPRTERFILTGIGAGAVAGFILGVLLPAGSGVGRGTAGLLVAIAGALAGGLISGSQAAFMEYTSGRSADRQRRDIETDWAPGVGVIPESPGAPQAPEVQDKAAPTAHDDEGAGNGSR